jgi:hypothetical protein
MAAALANKAKQIMSNKRILSAQMVTLRAIDNTGKNFTRGFASYQNLETFLATDAGTIVEIIDIA